VIGLLLDTKTVKSLLLVKTILLHTLVIMLLMPLDSVFIILLFNAMVLKLATKIVQKHFKV
jgi:hypothetical protein